MLASLAARIGREGPLPFDVWMEACLYDPDGGFFARGGGAGRAGGDFLTSPEVGALFGRLVGRAVDGWWDRLGQPDPFLVIEAGAGRGRLATAFLASEPRCGPALRYLLVERSAALRAFQAEHLAVEPASEALGPAFPPEPDETPELVPGTGPIVTSLAELPAGPFTAVVVANELLDNLPFRIVERTAAGWDEVRIGTDAGPVPQFAEVLVPADGFLAAEAEALSDGATVPIGTRIPIQNGMADWLRRCGAMLRRGAVITVDYGAPAADFAGRDWLRTYRAQRRGGDAWEEPGLQDITADIVSEALARSARRAGFEVVEDVTQAEWLRRLDVEGLVAEARDTWHARKANDLAALAARSTVHEAEALLDPHGLGAHRVTVLTRGLG